MPEVVIIGAGVIGLSVAWYLTERGVRSVVVERTAIGAGATAWQSGGVRAQWTSAENCRMALESQAFYRQLDDRLMPQVSPQLESCGYAFVARTPETMESLRRDAAEQKRLGVRTSVVDAGRLAELVPGLNTDAVVGGVYNGHDGYFARPQAVAPAFARAARRAGAEIHFGTARRLLLDRAGWTVELANGVRIVASDVVLAAGLGNPGLLDSLGSPLPIGRAPKRMFLSRPRDRCLVRPQMVFVDEGFSVKHLADGRLIAGHSPPGGIPTPDPDVGRGAVETVGPRLIATLEGTGYPWTIDGYYDTSPDAQLVVGAVPDHPRLWIAGAMNGRGMMLAPSVGRMVAESIATGDPEPIPTALQPDRFAGRESVTGETRTI